MVHKLKTIRGDMLVLQCQLERELIRYVRRYLCQPQVTIITNDKQFAFMCELYVIFDEPVLGLDANHRELFYSLLLKEFENNERTLIIATHLIEEVSNIIEEVVLIDKGKILLQETVEELLEKGYSISGVAQEVDHYCEGKNVIGYDELGGLKIAYVLGEKTALPQGSNLQVTAMNLQKLFVKMTEKGGGENE